MAVTVYDIAKKLDISVSTVSRVLNHSLLISDETSERIRKAAEELGYVPRKIKKQVNRAVITIKLFLNNKNDHLLPIFYDITDLLKGIREGAESIRLNLAVEMIDNIDSIFEHKKGGHLDGVIFAFTKPEKEVYEELKKRKIPNITLNRQLDQHDFVSGDNHFGIQELINAFKNKWDEPKICFLYLKPHNDVSIDRLNCLMEISKAEKLKFDSVDALGIESLNQIDKVFFDKISKKYNSVVAMNDVLAISVLARAAAFSCQIPKQFSLTGFDNSPVRNLLSQRLDTISLPVYEIGFKTGVWVKERIIQKQTNAFQFLLKGKYLKGETI